nr:MAG TPA: hypothetical protein [Caudoviricetes sp.]
MWYNKIKKVKINIKGGKRKNEKSVFYSKRAQISRTADHCQVSAVRYCSRANGACNGVYSSYVCYCVWFAINGEIGGKKMVTVKIEENDLLEMLVERVKFWDRSEAEANLYKKMYESEIDAGIFEDAELDINLIVDNDVVNYCNIIEEGNSEFDSILQLYKEEGLGDISIESNYSFIEAVDDEEEPKAFLVRY